MRDSHPGRVLFAAGEERYSRQKQHAGFPYGALADGLRYLNWSAQDFDVVSYAFLTAEREAEMMTGNINEALSESGPTDWRRALRDARRSSGGEAGDAIPGLDNANEKIKKGLIKTLCYRVLGTWPVVSDATNRYLGRDWNRRGVKDHKHWQTDLLTGIESFGIKAPLQRLEHHVSHAANAYYCSGFDRALVVSLDGYGSGLAGTVSVGEGGTIKRLQGLRFPNSLGTYYEQVTSCLGYRPDRHAGKIVGLAAYGDPERLTPLLLNRFQRQDGDF